MVGQGSRDLLLKFRDPLHISGTVGAKNVKFGMQIHPVLYQVLNKQVPVPVPVLVPVVQVPVQVPVPDLQVPVPVHNL